MHTFYPMGNIKYLYMSRTQRHIKSQHNIINEVSYAIFKWPANAAFISEKTMETNAEKESVRQAGKIISNESKLDEDKKTKGQEETQSLG